MALWTLAAKDLRLLLRDRRSAVILLVMPLVFILVLGLALGEGFGQKADDRLRVSIVKLDQGDAELHPDEPWVEVVQRDLAETAGIKIEVIASLEEAQELVRSGRRAAVIVFKPTFSKQVSQCSFLADGINPFYRDGIKLSEIDVDLLTDPTQPISAAVIDQVAQVSLMRVVLPWMIGRAFERLSDPSFIDKLGQEVRLPVPVMGRVPLARLLTLPEHKKAVGEGVQKSLSTQFPKYDLTGKTWAALTKSESKLSTGENVEEYAADGSGFLNRSSARYQTLVPSYTVMFAFFLVLTVGWLFVAERRQGTLKRLKAAPLSRTEILLGKLVPCLVLSLAQGLFLLGMGKLVFGMSWGPQPWWLLLVVASTSLAAMGLALLVASLAKTESQVAVYGTLLVLVLSGISGAGMERERMPEAMKQVSRVTPQAWALDAYAQLLRPPDRNTTPDPNLQTVATSCLVLTGFGLVFIGLSWVALKLE